MLEVLNVHILVFISCTNSKFNSLILCKHFTHLGTRDQKTFHTLLAKSFIGSYCSRKRPGQPSQATLPPKRFCNSHFLVRGSDKRHWCHYCSHHKNERMTHFGTARIVKYFCVTMVKTMIAFCRRHIPPMSN